MIFGFGAGFFAWVCHILHSTWLRKMASGGEEDEHGEQVCFVAPCCPHGSFQPPGRRWPLSVSSLGEDGAVLTPPEH